MMKRVLLTISYDGTAYHGWQVQKNAITVQETMQNSLERLLGVRPSLTGCSRTDSGVHAREFCCHLDCEDNIPPSAFLYGLNSILPNDIAVIGCRDVEPDFHARYSAKGKNYIYRFYHSKITDPFLSRYALRLERAPDIKKMDDFCRTLVGTHDFAPFCSSGSSVTDTVRTISECFMTEDGGLPALSVSADGFLYNMVRIITGTALAVSDGRLDVNCAEEIFATLDRSRAGQTAEPQGLYLNKVFY